MFVISGWHRRRVVFRPRSLYDGRNSVLISVELSWVCPPKMHVAGSGRVGVGRGWMEVYAASFVISLESCLHDWRWSMPYDLRKVSAAWLTLLSLVLVDL